MKKKKKINKYRGLDKDLKKLENSRDRINNLQKLKRNVFIAFIILFLFLIFYSIYFIFLHPKQCVDSACFLNAKTSCKRVTWIKDSSQATWFYEIEGKEKNNCKIFVKLLKLKTGTIDAEGLQGKSMNCLVSREDFSFPEKDLSRCHGELKEDIQDLIIQRMHGYLLKNLEDITQAFK